MSHQSELIGTDIDAYLAQHERKELLRFLTCGNVDDGKSTLIGRLLHDSKMIYEDQLEAVRKDSVKSGTTGGDMDLALLVDGLQAEREQGITIDVAYRYFSTSSRKFIIADTPGHEQYTRNMATGASTCDLAIILIDARNGVQTQTKRHSFIASLLGIKHIIVAINKMDLMEYREEVFNDIKENYLEFAKKLDLHDIRFLPISALNGDNVVNLSEHMPWYQGDPLMKTLETVEIAHDRNLQDMRLPVQYVNRPHLNFRGYCGTVAAGILRKGDPVTALPSGKASRIKSIVTYDGELEEAFAPMAVTVTLDDEIDVSRGDLLARADNLPLVADKFEAVVVWMTEEAMTPGKQYIVKLATRSVPGSVSRIRYRTDVNTLERHEAEVLHLNEIGLCEVSLNALVAFDPYKKSKGTGAFILIDRLTNVTVGAGMIAGRAGKSEHRCVSAKERAARFGQKAVSLWITGEKSRELAYLLERRLFDTGHAAAVVEDPGPATAQIADALKQAGLICLCVVGHAPQLSAADLSISAAETSADDVIAMLKSRQFLE